MDDSEKDWPRKLQYLATKELPQKVSRYKIPDALINKLSKVKSVTDMACALYRDRRTLYDPDKEIYSAIKRLYAIPSGQCAREFEFGAYEDFVRSYGELHKDFAGEDEQPRLTGAATSPPRSRQTGSPLQKGLPRPTVPSRLPGLAVIQLFATQIGQGTAYIGFDLSCGCWTVSKRHGLRVTMKRGIIAMNCGHASLNRETRKGFTAPYTLNGSCGKVSLTWHVGTTFSPEWAVEVEGDSIGNVEFPPDFAIVEDLAPGDVISIYFGAYPKDFETQHHYDAGNAEDTDAFEDISLIPTEGRTVDIAPEELSKLKKHIVTCMIANALFEDPQRNIPLASHEVEFVAMAAEGSAGDA